MKRKKGLTLVEIIVAIALLGIISVGFLYALTTHFTLLNKTKAMTQSYFNAQRSVEEEVDRLKNQISTGGLTLTSRTLFGAYPVQYYAMEYTINSKPYYSYISNVRPTSYTPLEMSSVSIAMKSGLQSVSNIYGETPFLIEGTFTNDSATRYDLLLNVVEWYVSSSSYLMPFPPNADFSLFDDIAYYSYFYPVFPRDYTLVATESINNYGTYTRNFPNISQYKGHHVVLGVTPGAKSGKVGVQMLSKPLFISGLPLISNLRLHMDAAYINEFNTSELNGDGDILKWNDLSSIIGNSMPSEFSFAVSGKDLPKLEYLDIGEAFAGKYAAFSSNRQIALTNQVVQNERLTLYVVVRNNEVTEDQVIINNLGRDIVLTEDETSVYGNEWILIKDIFDATSTDFYIGGSEFDIAELIVYSGDLSAADATLVEDYLDSKYRTPILGGEILDVEDIEVTVAIGTTYTPPNVVLANMVRGIQKYVSVEWTGTYNTNTVGQYVLVGYPLLDPTIQFTLTINVEE